MTSIGTGQRGAARRCTAGDQPKITDMNDMIMSPANPEIKRLKRLGKASERRRLGRFVVEGLRAIIGFLDHGWRPEQILVEIDRPLPDAWRDLPLRRVSDRVIAAVASSSSAAGYLAIFAIPQEDLPWRAEDGGLVLCGVADPGNVGTLIRSAVAFGWPQVILLGGADPYAPKVVQASAGALAGARLRRVDGLDEVAQLTGSVSLAALVVSDGQGVEQLAGRAVWLIVGSEAHGLSDEIIARCQHRVTLPMPGGGESLNAAVAGSIALYQLAMGLQGPC